MKPKLPTPAQLQEKIDELKHNAVRDAAMIQSQNKQVKDRDQRIVALEGENMNLIGQLCASKGRYDRLEATSVKGHWCLCMILIVFACGLFIGHKITQTGQKEVNPVVKYRTPEYWRTNHSYYSEAITNSSSTTLWKQPTNEYPFTVQFIYQKESDFKAQSFSNRHGTWTFNPNEKSQVEKIYYLTIPKTYHSIVTRKGAQLLRK